jgi:hypothetical protein
VPLEEVKKGNQITATIRQLVLPQPSVKSSAGSAMKKLGLSWART